MKTTSLLFTLFVLLSSISMQAQDYSELYNTQASFDSTKQGELSFRIENANFFRNHEFNSPVDKGYTLIGTWMRPMLEYYATNQLKIELGGHFLKYHGQDKFNQSLPWFSVRFRPVPEFEATLGCLNNNLNHKMIAPMYEPDRFLTSKPETGVQFSYVKNRWDAEVWLDWRQFIEIGDPIQEKFIVGIRADYSLIRSNNWDVSGAFQFISTHRGGEIDSSPNSIESLSNIAFGLKWKKQTTQSQWGGTAMVLRYNDMTSRGERAFEDGEGLFADLYYKKNDYQLALGYWHGYKFIAPIGRQLYQSVNPFDGEKYAARNLVSARFSKQFKITDGARFGLEADVYYDLDDGSHSYTYGIQLIFTESFFLKKLK